jgi:glutamyl-tRNA reductase
MGEKHSGTMNAENTEQQMQTILLIGLNHKTAPVEIRECLAFSGEEAAGAVEALRENDAVGEVVLFSTCNRVEVLLAAPDPDKAVTVVKDFLAEFKQVPRGRFEDAIYVHCGDEAVRHLFCVAASLDSMVVGEPQILGQMKASYAIAVGRKSAGTILNRLLHRAFSIAKRVRSETGIGDHAVSISYAAVELGRKIFGDLEGKKVLLVGAGEMAELAVEHLIRNRAGDLLVANRTFEHGVALAKRFRGEALRFEEIPDALAHVDIIISSTGSPDFVIVHSQVKSVMRSRRNRALFFIDIAVPRDIDPSINRISNVYVYDIDDLKGVVDENREDRQREAIKALRLIDEAVIQFRSWLNSLEVVPTIVALRNKIETIADAEIRKTVQQLGDLTDSQQSALLRMKITLANKLLHYPTLFLKKSSCNADKTGDIDTVRKLFHLDETAQDKKPS